MIFTVDTYADYLSQPSTEVDPTDPQTKWVVDELLKHVEGHGIGLAAPQIGQRLTIAVMQLDHYEEQGQLEHMTPVINPTMLLHTEKGICYTTEGCLSIPDKTYIVPRHKSIFMMYFDLKGNIHSVTLDGLAAIVAQHEYDHIHGKLINRVGKPVLPVQEEVL